MTATRALSAAERRIREHVLAINLGRCSWCDRPAANACHRLPQGQGGPYIAPNLLPGCGSGTTGCHALTERHRSLSYSCGWLIRSDDDPAGRCARVAATPALVRTQLGAGWHVLDGPRLAGPGEVPGWMFDGSYDDALTALHEGWAA